jgi:uncharacterized protein
MRHSLAMSCLPRLRLWTFVCVLLTSSIAAAQELPKPQGDVTDLADVLDGDAKAEAEARIRQAETKSGAEIAVATVPSLDGMSVEEYGNRLFNHWGIGKKGRDNGVLILVAPAERKIRIEVGYGLEPVLPDGLTGEIIRNDALPAFRDGAYGRGILASVNRVAAIVETGHIVTAEERAGLAADTEDLAPTWITTPFFGVFIALGAMFLGVGLRARAGFFVLFGSLFGGIPFLMALIPPFNASLWVLIPLAAMLFAFGLRQGGGAWREMARGTSGGSGSRRGSGGWVMGASSSSSSSSSSSRSSSSSSSSFGGGRSGGGGSSGSW